MNAGCCIRQWIERPISKSDFLCILNYKRGLSFEGEVGKLHTLAPWNQRLQSRRRHISSLSAAAIKRHSQGHYRRKGLLWLTAPEGESSQWRGRLPASASVVPGAARREPMKRTGQLQTAPVFKLGLSGHVCLNSHLNCHSCLLGKRKGSSRNGRGTKGGGGWIGSKCITCVCGNVIVKPIIVSIWYMLTETWETKGN